MKTSTKVEKDRGEIEIERKVWSTCFLCEEEYSTPTNKQQQQQEKEGGKEEEGNIVMNKECFHSYCKECIEQSASTSLLCPICHSSLPTPLSSLPINFTLCYWQSLSPPLPSFTLPLIPLLAEEEKNYVKIVKKRKQKFIALIVKFQFVILVLILFILEE